MLYCFSLSPVLSQYGDYDDAVLANSERENWGEGEDKVDNVLPAYDPPVTSSPYTYKPDVYDGQCRSASRFNRLRHCSVYLYCYVYFVVFLSDPEIYITFL